MPRRKLSEMNINQAVRFASRLGLDVSWRYEKQRYVDENGDPILSEPPMIHAYATVLAEAVVVKAEELHNTFENRAEFNSVNNPIIRRFERRRDRAIEEIAEAEATRDAVDAAPMVTP